jgi:hypothetical protein
MYKTLYDGEEKTYKQYIYTCKTVSFTESVFLQPPRLGSGSTLRVP